MLKKYHVFISYAKEDEAFATELSKSLKWLGLSVWFAPVTLEVGGKLLDSINAGLATSQYGLLLLSPTYIEKKWTAYEVDVLHRQHIEKDKKLFPLWHGITKTQLDAWNPGLSGLFALQTNEGASRIAEKIARVVYRECPVVGVDPTYENPQWRFLQGRGELFVNNRGGGAFNVFDAATFPESSFPIYVYERPHSRRDIVLAVAKALYYGSYDKLALMDDNREKMKAICIEHGFDLDHPDFDPAIYG